MSQSFASFAAHLEKLEATSSRLEMTALLADLFKQLSASELVPASYILQGQLLPAYEGVEFNLSAKTLIKVAARLYVKKLPDEVSSPQSESALSLFAENDDVFNQAEANRAEQLVNKKAKELGDMGLLLAEFAGATESRLSLEEVYQQLKAVALTNGAGSQEKKQSLLVELFCAMDSLSAKFSARLIMGKLRLGFSTMTLIDALSWAATGSKQDSSALEEAYQKKADFGQLAVAYLSAGDAMARATALATYTLQVGVPVVPALCQRLNSTTEVVEKMGAVYVEPKYDGLRVQIHMLKQADGSIMIRTFTRNLEESTAMFPELVAAAKHLDCQSCIIDGEAIGYDSATGQLLPFQQTITRKRKHEVAEATASVPLRFYIFDVLAIDNQSYIDKPLQERKALLDKLFGENEVFFKTPYLISQDPIEIRTQHTEYLAEGLEGAVFKQASSVYQSGRKGWSWVKMKESEGMRGKLNDTVDCVVMGYYLGRGKRTQFGIGALLVGVRNENQEIVTLAKIGTGVSEAQLVELREQLTPSVVGEKPKNYHVDEHIYPDVWCLPEMVVEIAADELTQSPLHTAGVALRFPRFIRIRDDKKWEQATERQELDQLLNQAA